MISLNKLFKLSVVALFVMVAVLTITPPESAEAHTTQFAWRFEDASTVTFFAGTYHTSETASMPVGGVLVNGVRHDFVGFVNNLPSDVDGVTPCASPSPSDCGDANLVWQYVTVTGFTPGTYNLGTTSDSAIEEPWSGNPIVTIEITVPEELQVCPVKGEYTKVGQVQIEAPGTALYEAPAAGVIRNSAGNEIWVPNVTAHDISRDVYDVIRYDEVGGETWANIFIGNTSCPVWVPVGGPVTVIN